MKEFLVSLKEWTMQSICKMLSKKTVFAVGAIALGGGVYYVIRKLPTGNASKESKEYVFFGSDGKPFILSEAQVYSIKQESADGVMVSEIAGKYNTTPVMVARIVNGISL